MENNFTYPVIINRREKGNIIIKFPDFEGELNFCKIGDDYIKLAQDHLASTIIAFESEGKKLPIHNLEDDIILDKDETLIYISVWMPYHRSKIKETYVKKTLTIPAWLDVLAKNNNMNFSAVLVEGLKEKLGV